LINAAYQGQRDAVTLLLDNKASIEAKSTTRNALIAAACAGQIDAARTLVDRGADVNGRTPSQTALGCAAQRGDVEFIRLLLDRGADVNATAANGLSPLHLAVENIREMDKAVASALLLINRGANVNTTRPEYVDTPLSRAVDRGLLDVVRALLEKGANPNRGSVPPLTRALNGPRPNADVAILLIEKGADVTEGTEPPLILAIRSRQVSVIRALLAKGADPNLGGRNGQTPLRVASDSPEIQQLLVQAGAKQ
jgi:ankyrin repeat protein